MPMLTPSKKMNIKEIKRKPSKINLHFSLADLTCHSAFPCPLIVDPPSPLDECYPVRELWKKKL